MCILSIGEYTRAQAVVGQHSSMHYNALLASCNDVTTVSYIIHVILLFYHIVYYKRLHVSCLRAAREGFVATA